MTKAEFIKQAKEYGYSEEAIKDLLQGYDETKRMIPNFDYSEIVLIEQPEY